MPSSPSMPALSMPKVGSGEFYSPSSKDFYSGISTSSTTVKSTASTDTAQNTTSAAAQSQAFSQNTSALQTQALTVPFLTQSETQQLTDTLTAGNINSLNNMGLLSSLQNVLSSKYTASQASADAIKPDSTQILEQILTELNALKSQVSQNALAENAAKEESISKILRFTVNGYDVKATCREIFISDTDTNKSFVISGDRRYQSDGRTRTETFYILFLTEGSKDGIMKYGVTTEVSQDTENPYSFLYQLSKRGKVTANRTGNFVSLRINDDAWKFDMLISLK